MRRRALPALACVAVLCAPGVANAGVRPEGAGAARHAVAIASRVPAVRQELAQHPGVKPLVDFKKSSGFEVRWIHNGDQGVAVELSSSGAIRHVWRGYQAQWDIARGVPSAVAGAAAHLWIWLAFAVAFAIPFVDVRRPLSLRNADLAALLGLSVSFAFFAHADLGLSVPLLYPPLVYLLCRLLAVGAGIADPPSWRPNVSTRWLAVALAPIAIARITLALVSTYSIDVTYFTLDGANHFAHSTPFYGHVASQADHYGPVIYLAYVPFVAIWRFAGQWDPVATHVANIVFDLLTAGALYLIGHRLGGRRAGIVLAYGWLSLPVTLFALCGGTNDGVVALIVTAALAMAARPAVAGALIGLGALTKVAPGLLIPAFASHPGIDDRATRTRAPRFLAGLVLAAVLVMAPVLAHTSLSMFVQRTFSSEDTRYSPLAIWGLYDPSGTNGLGYVAQSTVRSLAAILAVVVAVRPRTRSYLQLIALTGAILIATQLGAAYWLYPYAVWWLPAAIVGLLGTNVAVAASASRRRASASAAT